MAYTRTQSAWADGAGGNTPIDAVDLENYDQGLLATNNDLVVLYWTGSTYLPKNGNASTISDISKGRLFVGPTDPATVAGVVLTELDRWDQYT